MAIATPPGQGGVAIVRVSGSASRVILERCFRSHRPLAEWESHRLYLGKVVDCEGRVLDEALAVWMQSPHTYTCEDVVELHLHGSPVLARTVVDLCLACGGRLAQPGEFTLRAYLHGRLDLAQAESVAQLIAARSRAQVELAGAALVGRFSERVEAVRQEILEWLARLEAEIDFGDEVPSMSAAESTARLGSIASQVEALLAGAEAGRLRSHGLRVALIGPPNAGKSTLLNRLLGEERALVSPYPGTTRDRLEETAVVGGVTLELTDTAGIRTTEDPVESMGVQLSERAARAAELVVLVLDGSREWPAGDWDRLGGKRPVVVLNKEDLGTHLTEDGVRARFPEADVARVSLLSGKGWDELLGLLVARTRAFEARTGEVWGATERQREALVRSREALHEVGQAVAGGLSAEFVCLDLRRALEGLNQILGLDVTEDVLDRVFSTFCLGK